MCTCNNENVYVWEMLLDRVKDSGSIYNTIEVPLSVGTKLSQV